MLLDRVTVTGADDSLDPSALVDLGRRFPYVEWGILYSGTRQGSPRYPGEAWLEKLGRTASENAMRLSAHLCGRWVRDLVLNGDFTFRALNPLWRVFERVQLNFHGQFHRGRDLWHENLRRNREKQYILQYDGINDPACGTLLRSPHFDAVPLFDRSGGAGILPGEWPKSLAGVYCGYAGGLGPENLAGQLPLIGKAAGVERVWIDMETGVRSDDDAVFDLHKVRRCLEIAAPFVTGTN